METMQSWFGLKPEHHDFSIENAGDARLFFARADIGQRLESILKRSFRTLNPPKMVLYGDWGVGKTHTMRHLEYVIENTPAYSALVVFAELPDIVKKSSFQVAHSALLDALGIDAVRDWMIRFQANHGTDTQHRLTELSQSADVATAFTSLNFGTGGRIAWEWLRGSGVSAADARMVGLTGPVNQSLQFVRILQILGTLSLELDERVLVFMLDEATKLDAVSDQDAINHWTNSLKVIADPLTKEVGFIISGAWIDPDDMPLPLQEEQVHSRFGDSNYIRLDNFGEDRTRDFISHLVQEWVEPALRDELIATHATDCDGETVTPSSFPFTTEALPIAVSYACRLGGFTTPRDIQKTLDDLLNRAIDDGRHILSSPYVTHLVNS